MVPLENYGNKGFPTWRKVVGEIGCRIKYVE
jgi:hypothetical protein